MAAYVANQLNYVHVNAVDLDDYSIPFYGIDIENENGIRDDAGRLNDLLLSAKDFVIFFAEHNGIYAAVFKNIYGWLSRINTDIWTNKPMF